MSDTKQFEIKETTLNGYRIKAEFRDVPVAFVNALRRILLAEIPTVVVRDVQILENTSHMIHEMLRHRVEQLPVNVRPDEADIIRDTKIELRFLPDTKEKIITSNEFVIAGPRQEVLLRDRDLNTDLYFMTLKPNESIHIKASLAVEMTGASQVCVSTFKNHINQDVAKVERDAYILNGGDPRVFDNFDIQRHYSVDDQQRPNWFDFTVESIGVQPAKDLLKQAVLILKNKVLEWSKTPMMREQGNWYYIETENEGHTLGNFAQQMIYLGGLVDFVSYRIPHPLLPEMIVTFQTKASAESVITRFKEEAVALCESILSQL